MTPNEETGRRFCMLTEFMLGKPVFKSYKSLCSKIGDETISYQEFDFWFHRFAQGKLDLSYDRSLDTKPKELSDMPIEIVDNIVDYLGPVDRLSVRNVSRDLRALIDKRTTDVKRIEFSIFPCRNTFSVSIDNDITYYEESDKPKLSTSHASCYYTNGQGADITDIEGPGAMKNSLIHLAHYLKNPYLKLKNLLIYVHKEETEEFYENWDIVKQCYKKLESFLLSLEHQISAEAFFYSYVSKYTFLVALKSLKPGVLKNIGGEDYGDQVEDDSVMDGIVGTEQWKLAKRLTSWNGISALVDGIAYFEEFFMDWRNDTPENVVRLKQLLSESKTFKKGELSIFNPRSFAPDAAIDRIVDALEPRIFRDPENPLKWSYPIPDTNEFLDFYYEAPFTFSVERTT